MNFAERNIILGSASPRRQQLLRELFPRMEVRVKPVNEEFPTALREAAIPVYLAGQKADAFNGELNNRDILITADTVVWFDNHVLNKPADRTEAVFMLKKLSGNVHQVFTGICISSPAKRITFSAESSVKFRKIAEKDFGEYIDQYQPYDKAGSYGAQECLPEGLNPLSDKEKKFLVSIHKPDLFERSLAVKDHARVPLIERIEGSYFNVMGLPIVELVESLNEHFGN